LITFSRFGAILLFAGIVALPLVGAQKKEARVTQVIRDVRLLVSQAAPRPASLNDNVTDGTAVRTGTDSRAEFTFADLTITRVGANSIFSFNRGGRSVDVESGAILLRVPRDSSYDKLIILEGAARATLRLHPAQAVPVSAGQMLVAQSGARTLPNPIEIDLDRLMKTATLVTKFRPLPSLNLILAAIEDHNRAGAQLINPDFTPTGLDARDVVAAIRSQSTPSRPKSGKPPPDSRKP